MSETPYQTLKRRGVPIEEFSISIFPSALKTRKFYIARLKTCIRIGQLHEHGETSFVIPKSLFYSIVERVKAWS